MNENEAYDFKYNLVFNSIYSNIQRKKDLSENSKIYVDWAKELFQNFTKSIDSIIYSDNGEGYFETPYLKEIIKCSVKKFPKTIEEFKELKEKFSFIINDLDNFKKDPKKFYKTKESKEILDLSEKLISVYDLVVD